MKIPDTSSSVGLFHHCRARLQTRRAVVRLLPGRAWALSSCATNDRICFDLADESIAAAWQRLDIARVISGVTERLAQPPHGGVEAVLEIDEGIVRPQALAKLVAVEELAGAIQKGKEKPERLLRQNDVRAVGVQLAGAGIQFEGTKSKASGGWERSSSNRPDHPALGVAAGARGGWRPGTRKRQSLCHSADYTPRRRASRGTPFAINATPACDRLAAA